MSSSFRWLLPFALLATLGGCGLFRRPDPTVELLESELRWMEDNLYVLDEQLNRCCEQLESARRNNAVLRDELARATASPAPHAAESAPPDSHATRPFDQPRDEDLYDLSSPIVETGEPATEPMTDEDTPTTSDEPDDAAPRPVPESVRPSATDTDAEPFTQQSEHLRVDRIVLNQKLTGGYELDGQSGHDGVMVVVEPRHAGVGYVPVPGKLTVEVVDPSQSGLDARVGKWTFDAVECASRMKKTLFGQGVHLQLPWPGAAPQHEALQLSVSYETADGRTLQATERIRIKLPVSVQATHPMPGTVRQAERSSASTPRWSPVR